MSMLIENILSALENKYAVSEIIWDPSDAPNLSAEVRHVPLWFFENTQGYLRFKKSSFDTGEGIDLEPDGWMVSVSDSPLMEATAVCYIIKRFAQADWASCSGRFGTPTPVYGSSAARNSPEWNEAIDLISRLSAGSGIVLAAGESFDFKMPAAGTSEPFKTLYDAMDRAIALIWRGSDLSTLSAGNAAGASLQADESEILEDADCALVEETIARYLTIPALEWRFGKGVKPAAYLQLTRKNRSDKIAQIRVFKGAAELGCPPSKRDVYEALELREPEEGEDVAEVLRSEPDVQFANSESAERELAKKIEALAAARAKDVAPLTARLEALGKITDPAEYADALLALEKDLESLYSGGANEAAALENLIKEDLKNDK